MSRLLGLVVLAVLIWLVLEAALVRLRLAAGVAARPIRPPQRPPGPAEIAETLVRCPGCGVHVPQKSLIDGRCERCGPRG